MSLSRSATHFWMLLLSSEEKKNPWLFLVRMYLVQSLPSSLRSISMLFNHHCLGLPCFSFLPVLPQNFHVYFLFPPMLVTCSAHLVLLLILTALIIFLRDIHRLSLYPNILFSILFSKTDVLFVPLCMSLPNWCLPFAQAKGVLNLSSRRSVFYELVL